MSYTPYDAHPAPIFRTFIDTQGIQHMHVPIVWDGALGMIEIRPDGSYQIWWKDKNHRYWLNPRHWAEEQLGYMRSLLGG